MPEEKLDINDKELKRALRGFNFAAAYPYLGILWAVFNKCFKKFALHNIVILVIIWIITLLVYNSFFKFTDGGPKFVFGWIIGLLFWESLAPIPILYIYNGIMGNRWAWNSKNFNTLQDFKKSKMIWNLIGLCFLFMTALEISHAIINAHNYFRDYTNLQLNIAREKCRISKETLTPIFNKFGSRFDPQDIAFEWEKDSKVIRAWDRSEHGKIIIDADVYNELDTKHRGQSRIDLRIVKSPYCEISGGNCYFYLNHELTDDVDYTCRFYFDNSGRVVPSKGTLKFMSDTNSTYKRK